jgi:hypothetical protein
VRKVSKERKLICQSFRRIFDTHRGSARKNNELYGMVLYCGGGSRTSDPLEKA